MFFAMGFILCISKVVIFDNISVLGNGYMDSGGLTIHSILFWFLKLI